MSLPRSIQGKSGHLLSALEMNVSIMIWEPLKKSPNYHRSVICIAGNENKTVLGPPRWAKDRASPKKRHTRTVDMINNHQCLFARHLTPRTAISLNEPKCIRDISGAHNRVKIAHCWQALVSRPLQSVHGSVERPPLLCFGRRASHDLRCQRMRRRCRTTVKRTYR
jgi:hypothetical protein